MIAFSRSRVFFIKLTDLKSLSGEIFKISAKYGKTNLKNKITKE